MHSYNNFFNLLTMDNFGLQQESWAVLIEAAKPRIFAIWLFEEIICLLLAWNTKNFYKEERKIEAN